MNILRQDPNEVADGISRWRRKAARWLSAHPWTRILEPALILIGGIGIGLWIWPTLYQPSPGIRPEFLQAYKQHGVQLHNPIDNATLATLPDKDGRGVVQSLFENAWLLWLDNPGKLYAIPVREPARHFSDDDDAFFGGPTWTGNDEETRKRPAFDKVPQSCKLPLGGFLISWDKDPTGWSWVGCGQWYCYLDGHNIFFQDFDGGRIIGPLRVAINVDESQNLVLYKDGRHFLVRSSERAPTVLSCEYGSSEKGASSP